MNILLHPSMTLSIAAVLLIVYGIGIMKNSKITSILISRLFLLLGAMIFADNYYSGHYGGTLLLESGSIFFELGLATMLVAPFLLSYRKKKQTITH